MKEQCMSKSCPIKEFATSFLRLASSGQVDEAYGKFVGTCFFHHNPYFASDAESLKRAMRENALNNPQMIFEIQRAIHEEQFVVVHSRVRMNANHLGVSLVHIFRFEGEKIVELWDIGQPVPENSVNEHGMF